MRLANQIDTSVMRELQATDEMTKLRTKVQTLEQELTRLRKVNKKLEDKIYHDSWKSNPDRNGGAFTEYEITEANTWR